MSKEVKLSPKIISIVLKPKVISDFSSVLPNLVSWLHKRKKQVCFLSEEEQRILKIFKTQPKGVKFIDEKELHTNSDLIITMGGDGTLIGVARKAKKSTAPVFGVNMGRLGFITEFSKAEFFEYLTMVLEKKVELTKINLYKAEVLRTNGELDEGYFLNDGVISKNDISRMLSINVENETESIYSLSGDGLIVSSPIGSTAYSLAAGGPIIQPNVNAITLTPICPHSLTHRPLVISDKEKIIIKVPKGQENLSLTLDGQQLFSLNSKDIVTIRKSTTRYIHLVKNPERTYFHTLKEKFTHGRRSY